MHELALVVSFIAFCCATGSPAERRQRLVTSALMTAAMFDTAVLQSLAPVFWAVLLLTAALILSAGQRARSGRAGSDAYTPAGLVVMAALVMAPAHAHTFAIPDGGHSHGEGGAALPLLMGVSVALGVLYVAASVHRTRHGSAADRGHHAAMGASTVLMVAAVLA